MYLLDTCIVCELRRRYPDSRIIDWIESIADEELFISVATLGVMQRAIERQFTKDPKKAAKLENWLNLLAASPNVVPIEDQIIRLAASWQYENPGIDHAITLIAATATVGRLVLTTSNPAPFLPLGLLPFNPCQILSAFFSEKFSANARARA